MRRGDLDDPFKEVLGHDVRRAAGAGGAELRRRGTRIVDKFLQGFGSARRRGYHFRRGRDNRYGFELFRRVAALRIKRFIDRQRGRRAKNCIAIRLCRDDVAMRQIAGRAGAIFNDHGLAELDLQLLADKARDHVDKTTRRKATPDGDGLRRIGIGMRGRSRSQGQHGSHREKGAAQVLTGRGHDAWRSADVLTADWKRQSTGSDCTSPDYRPARPADILRPSDTRSSTAYRRRPSPPPRTMEPRSSLLPLAEGQRPKKQVR